MATVLPEPVWEVTRRSRPARAGSSTAFWTVVSSVKPFSEIAAPSAGPSSSAKSTVAILRPLVALVRRACALLSLRRANPGYFRASADQGGRPRRSGGRIRAPHRHPSPGEVAFYPPSGG